MSNADPTFSVDPSFWDEAAADAEGLADIEAGRVIPREEVAAWLDTWGTPDEKPAPAHWFK